MNEFFDTILESSIGDDLDDYSALDAAAAVAAASAGIKTPAESIVIPPRTRITVAGMLSGETTVSSSSSASTANKASSNSDIDTTTGSSKDAKTNDSNSNADANTHANNNNAMTKTNTISSITKSSSAVARAVAAAGGGARLPLPPSAASTTGSPVLPAFGLGRGGGGGIGGAAGTGGGDGGYGGISWEGNKRGNGMLMKTLAGAAQTPGRERRRGKAATAEATAAAPSSTVAGIASRNDSANGNVDAKTSAHADAKDGGGADDNGNNADDNGNNADDNGSGGAGAKEEASVQSGGSACSSSDKAVVVATAVAATTAPAEATAASVSATPTATVAAATAAAAVTAASSGKADGAAAASDVDVDGAQGSEDGQEMLTMVVSPEEVMEGADIAGANKLLVVQGQVAGAMDVKTLQIDEG